MQTIGTLIGSQIRRDHRVVTDLPDVGGIGIELELEGGLFGGVAGWDVHNDGSLRDGVEYVFQGAQAGSKALDSITAMGEAFERMAPRPTFRCSTHCHVDVRDLNFDQIHKMLAAYSIFEDVLFDHCQEYRRWSNFCTPYFVSEKLLEYYGNCVTGQRDDASRIHRLGSFPKYSAFNVQPIGRFGSLEFRGSHAIVDGQELLALAQRMLHLKRVVLEAPMDQSLGDFITATNKMNPLQAFPQGLMGGYSRDQELADMCYANALKVQKVLLPPTKESRGTPLDILMAGGHRAGPIQAAVQGVGNLVTNNLIRTNPDGYARYGLIPADGPVTWDVAFRTLVGMSEIRGIVPPRARDLFINGSIPQELLGEFINQLERRGLRP